MRLRLELGLEQTHLVILSPRPKRSDCALGDRLQIGNSVSVSHSCSERNGVFADAAVSSIASTRSSPVELVKARGATHLSWRDGG